jgi:cell division protein FtsL
MLYAIAITIPLFIALDAWQASRYSALASEVRRLEKNQQEWVESNKRLIAGIAVLSSSDRIERIAQEELRLFKKKPEEVLNIRIEGGRDSDG